MDFVLKKKPAPIFALLEKEDAILMDINYAKTLIMMDAMNFLVQYHAIQMKHAQMGIAIK